MENRLDILILIALCVVPAVGADKQNALKTPNAVATNKVAFYILAKPLDTFSARKMKLEDLILEQKPLFTSDDILSYDTSSHSFLLNQVAYERLLNLDVPLLGTPFVATIGKRRVYLGAFWSPISSYGSSRITIMAPTVKKSEELIIRPATSALIDLRNDPALLEIMKGRTRPRQAK